MRYISIKNRIRVLALAMIAFPEPVSTVLGIMILGATIAVYRQKSLDKFGNAEILIKRSLNDLKNVGFRHYSGTEQSVVNHMMKASLPSQPLKDPGISAFNQAIPQYYSWFDNRKVSEPVLHHTLKTSFLQYEAVSGSLQTGSEQHIQHHKLKMNLIPDANTSLH
jgi:hypothetical protein